MKPNVSYNCACGGHASSWDKLFAFQKVAMFDLTTYSAHLVLWFMMFLNRGASTTSPIELYL